jgi:hypothetical protein
MCHGFEKMAAQQVDSLGHRGPAPLVLPSNWNRNADSLTVLGSYWLQAVDNVEKTTRLSEFQA